MPREEVMRIPNFRLLSPLDSVALRTRVQRESLIVEQRGSELILYREVPEPPYDLEHCGQDGCLVCDVTSPMRAYVTEDLLDPVPPAPNQVECAHCTRTQPDASKLRTFTLNGEEKYGCVGCTKKCGDCRERFYKADMVRQGYTLGGNTNYICKGCAKKYKRCKSCGLKTKQKMARVESYQPRKIAPIKLRQGGTYVIHDLWDVFRALRRGWITKNPYKMEKKREARCAGCENNIDLTFTCNKCERPIHRNYGWHLRGGGALCYECTVDTMEPCMSCENLFPIGSLNTNRECESCAAVTLKQYGYKPAPQFRKLDAERNPFYFGIELEVEARRQRKEDMSVILKDTLGPDFYFKRDGSLSDTYGIEIVTHPMTIAYFKSKEYGKLIESFKDDLGAYYRRSCGMHIHIGKAQFKGDDEHLFRFIEFHYANQKFVTFIGQRALNGYCSLNERTTPDRIKQVVKDKCSLGDGHTNAVNTSNEETIELRYFRSNILGDRILKNMEWIKCLFEFTKQCDEKHLSVPYFLGYLEKHKRRYSTLYEFVDRRNRQFLPMDLPDIDVGSQDRDRIPLIDGAYLISTGAGHGHTEVVKSRL